MSSTTARSARTATVQQEWWIHTDGRAEGPYSSAFVRVTLERADSPGDVRICPVGEKEWRPAREWPDFADLTRSRAAVVREHGPAVSVDHKLMLRVIGVYAAVVAPLLFLLEMAATFTGNSLVNELASSSRLLPYGFALDLFWSVLDAGTTAFLCLAGWWLLSLRSKSVATTLIALGLRMFSALLQIPIVILWQGLVESQASQLQGEPPMGTWLVFCNLLLLASFLFELVALTWLLLNRDWLRHADAMRKGSDQ